MTTTTTTRPRRNPHLTHQANIGVGRHGWLRLTPAYSVQLVRSYVANLAPRSVVTDPFSGTGTTPLAAAEHGHFGQSTDLNPFLIWLGSVKTANYDELSLTTTDAVARSCADAATAMLTPESVLWQPPLHNIDRWWSSGVLLALRALRAAIDGEALPGSAQRNLLDVAFCRTMIGTSNAAFNHQSMSFKAAPLSPVLFSLEDATAVVAQFAQEVSDVVESARKPLSGTAGIALGDARALDATDLEPCDLLLTSPPYVNRMSYIRELRPYMYWLRYIQEAKTAGEIDWQSIGGTWGTATSRLMTWTREGDAAPPLPDLPNMVGAIAADGGKNGPLLARYVTKYFHDMWAHFRSALPAVKPGGRVIYIVGNSTFYKHVVPAEKWYAELLTASGFEKVQIETIRKRNSKKELFEFAVSALRP
jgi:hypothetical protein